MVLKRECHIFKPDDKRLKKLKNKLGWISKI